MSLISTTPLGKHILFGIMCSLQVGESWIFKQDKIQFNQHLILSGTEGWFIHGRVGTNCDSIPDGSCEIDNQTPFDYSGLWALMHLAFHFSMPTSLLCERTSKQLILHLHDRGSCCVVIIQDKCNRSDIGLSESVNLWENLESIHGRNM